METSDNTGSTIEGSGIRYPVAPTPVDRYKVCYLDMTDDLSKCLNTKAHEGWKLIQVISNFPGYTVIFEKHEPW